MNDFDESYERILKELAATQKSHHASTSDGRKAPISSPESGKGNDPTQQNCRIPPLFPPSKTKTAPWSVPDPTRPTPSSGQPDPKVKNISIDDVVKQLQDIEKSMSSRISKKTSLTGTSLRPSKSKEPPDVSGSPLNTAQGLGGGLRRSNSATPEGVVLSEGSPLQMTSNQAKSNRPGNIPDSIPEGSREEKPGRLQAEEAARRMEAEQKTGQRKLEVHQREVTSTEVASVTQEGTHKCMCCVS
jgi:hypothetical protein